MNLQSVVDTLDMVLDVPTQEAISSVKFSPVKNCHQVYMQRGPNMYMVAIATWDGKCMVWAIQYNEMQG